MYFSAVAPYTNANRIIHYSFSNEGGVFVNYDKSVLQVVGKHIQKLRQQKSFTQQAVLGNGRNLHQLSLRSGTGRELAAHG